MGRKYRNPPIIEAVCELRLTPDSRWDLTIPGMIYEKISNDFPNKEPHLAQDVEITRSPQGLQQQTRTSERVWFLTENRQTFIQLGAHYLAVNRLAPYPSWEGYKPSIKKAFDALTNTIAEIKGLQRIGLRYINRIEIPGETIELEDYFEFYPFLGQHLPQNIQNFNVQCLFSFLDDRDSCRVQLARALGVYETSQQDKPGILLDLDYFLAKPQTVSADHALEWVETAHQKVEEIFEGCITDRSRELFGEEK